MKRVTLPLILVIALAMTLVPTISSPLVSARPLIAQDDGGAETEPAPEPTATPTETATPTSTPTATAIPTEVPTPTPPPTSEVLPTPTTTASPTGSPTPNPAQSPTARPATATGTPTPTATPSFSAAATPSCSLGTLAGVVGQKISVSCTGFPSGSRARVYWQGGGPSLASLTIATNGTGKVIFSVPAVSAGVWRVRTSDGAGIAATSLFTVRPPTVGLAPSTGAAGSRITVRLRGFRAGESVALRFYSLTATSFISLGAVVLSTRGAADPTVTIPSKAGRGGHRIEAIGSTSGLTASTTFTVAPPGQTQYLVQGAPGCGRIAFIFNVGVGYQFDTGILATLKAKGVPATMFVMGYWADQNRALLNRLAADGYVIGSHGYAARDLTTQSDSYVINDVQRAAAAIERALGAPPGPWFTPYAAAIDTRVRNLIAGQGLTPVGWRISARDFDATASSDEVYQRVVANAYDGAIVEFHIDGPATASSTGRALPRIIDTLRSRGYHFVTIPDMATACAHTTTPSSTNHLAIASSPPRAAAPLTVRRQARRRTRPGRRFGLQSASADFRE